MKHRKPHIHSACTLALLLALGTPLAHAGLKDAQAAYKRQDYAAAFKEFTPLAQAGNATAQYRLGVMYAEGEGVAQDYQQAHSWFLKAAKQGHVEAQNSLGLMYMEGMGVPRDEKQATFWLEKAAKKSGDKQTQQIIKALLDPELRKVLKAYEAETKNPPTCALDSASAPAPCKP